MNWLELGLGLSGWLESLDGIAEKALQEAAIALRVSGESLRLRRRDAHVRIGQPGLRVGADWEGQVAICSQLVRRPAAGDFEALLDGEEVELDLVTDGLEAFQLALDGGEGGRLGRVAQVGVLLEAADAAGPRLLGHLRLLVRQLQEAMQVPEDAKQALAKVAEDKLGGEVDGIRQGMRLRLGWRWSRAGGRWIGGRASG